ncbi:MAG: hypothetical protein AABX03_05380 [Nanoarchaeota archaeon]
MISKNSLLNKIGGMILVGSSLIYSPFAYGNAGVINEAPTVSANQAVIGYPATEKKDEAEKYKIKEDTKYFALTEKKETSNPRVYDHLELLRATSEYQQIEEEKIERGTGKYWILLSRASDIVNNAMTEEIQETGADVLLEYKSEGSDGKYENSEFDKAEKYLEVPEGQSDIKIMDVTNDIVKRIKSKPCNDDKVKPDKNKTKSSIGDIW